MDDISLIDVFENSNERGLLTLTGGGSVAPHTGANRPDFDSEIFHANDVEELPADLAADFPMFQAGDLLVSLRNRNLVAVVDRDDRRIKWWQIGPWVRQHDPDWKAGGTITVFDNNTNDAAVGSRVIEVDPATSRSWVVYGGQEDQHFYTAWRGKHQNLSGDRTLVTESLAGRVFEVNSDGEITWELVNRYSESEIGIITEARAYPAGYFSLSDWSCPDR